MGVGGGGRGLQLFPPQDMGGDSEAEATQPSPTQTAGTGRSATTLPPGASSEFWALPCRSLVTRKGARVHHPSLDPSVLGGACCPAGPALPLTAGPGFLFLSCLRRTREFPGLAPCTPGTCWRQTLPSASCVAPGSGFHR